MLSITQIIAIGIERYSSFCNPAGWARAAAESPASAARRDGRRCNRPGRDHRARGPSIRAR